MIETKNCFITVVSGLPRTGTSMMMRVLAAGGMPVLTDNQRRSDDDNPGGYYELERVKQLKTDASWLADAQGKAVKVIYRLLYDLPLDYHYKVIFMKRNLAEVVASQKVMLGRQRRSGAMLDDQQLIRAFAAELAKVEYWLSTQLNFEVHSMGFNSAINNAENTAAAIADFLGHELDIAEMAKVVDPTLYRQRIGG